MGEDTTIVPSLKIDKNKINRCLWLRGSIAGASCPRSAHLHGNLPMWPEFPGVGKFGVLLDCQGGFGLLRPSSHSWGSREGGQGDGNVGSRRNVGPVDF